MGEYEEVFEQFLAEDLMMQGMAGGKKKGSGMMEEEDMLSSMMADMLLGGAADRGKAAKEKAKSK